MRRHVWWILGLVLVGVGVALVLIGRGGPADFGWTAYTPLSEDPDWEMHWGGDPAWVVSRWQLVGSGAVVIGLALLAGGFGFQLGRRSEKARERP